MAKLTLYTIKQIMDMEIKFDWLIQKFLRVGDIWLIKAQKKKGKGVLAQQLAFALSNGSPFLDCFKVLKPCKVAYMSGEGYLGDWKKRFTDMQKLWPCEEDNITFVDCVQSALHTKEGALELLEILQATGVQFDVLVFDPLYKLAAGANMNDNTQMTEFFDNIEMLVKSFEASAIVVHHDSEKVYTDNRGKKHSSASIKNAMGASAITMAVTHYATLSSYKNDKKKLMHKLEMGDCRSSEYLHDIEMHMIIPEKDDNGRLGYTIDDGDINANYHTIKGFLYSNKRLASHEPYRELNMASATFYRQVKHVMDHGFAEQITDSEGKGWYVYKEPDVEENENVHLTVERGCPND